MLSSVTACLVCGRWLNAHGRLLVHHHISRQRGLSQSGYSVCILSSQPQESVQTHHNLSMSLFNSKIPPGTHWEIEMLYKSFLKLINVLGKRTYPWPSHTELCYTHTSLLPQDNTSDITNSLRGYATTVEYKFSLPPIPQTQGDAEGRTSPTCPAFLHFKLSSLLSLEGLWIDLGRN